jgi:hypothetical protein
MRTTTLRSRIAALALAAIVAAAAAGCGETAQQGRSPVIVVVERMEAAALGEGEFQGVLLSDVVTNGGIFNDLGRATFRLALKNPGVPTAPLGPSTLNEVTLSRYRVRYVRTDGRNTQGVHVPWGFDAGMTVTIPANGSAQAVFELVRHSAKEEPPLKQLANLGSASLINTICEVTFYGQDLSGNEIVVTANIACNFGDFADPD